MLGCNELIGFSNYLNTLIVMLSNMQKLNNQTNMSVSKQTQVCPIHWSRFCNPDRKMLEVYWVQFN